MKNLITFFSRNAMLIQKLKFLLTWGLIALGACTYEKTDDPTTCISNLTLSIDQVEDTDCGLATGSIQVSASGGTGVLRFQLDEFAIQENGSFANLSSGTYTVKVVDENNCIDTQEVEVKNLDGINIELLAQESGCGSTSGSIQIQATGGIEPYMFRIDGSVFQTSSLFSNLAAGSYTIEGMDANGCQITKTVDITSGVSLQDDIKPIIDQNCALSTCHGGSQSPDLRSVENIRNSATRIKIRTENRSMPRGRTLTQEQIDMIACWVDDGALDN